MISFSVLSQICTLASGWNLEFCLLGLASFQTVPDSGTRPTLPAKVCQQGRDGGGQGLASLHRLSPGVRHLRCRGQLVLKTALSGAGPHSSSVRLCTGLGSRPAPGRCRTSPGEEPVPLHCLPMWPGGLSPVGTHSHRHAPSFSFEKKHLFLFPQELHLETERVVPIPIYRFLPSHPG